MMRNKIGITAALLALAISVSVDAGEYNFYDRAKERGCASIITDTGVIGCKTVQSAKDAACNVPMECDVDKQQRLIEKYNELTKRLADGDVPVADRDKLKTTIGDIKADLNDRKTRASNTIPVAEGCVTARENVQRWFSEIGIPLTESTRDNALKIRQGLLDTLEDAKRQQTDAAAKRAANPSDSTIQALYERATQSMRDAEKALGDFNIKYSKDIEYYASRLIEGYRSEKAAHEKPLDEAKNRRDNCKKVAGLSY